MPLGDSAPIAGARPFNASATYQWAASPSSVSGESGGPG
jgi:hypothetical protein